MGSPSDALTVPAGMTASRVRYGVLGLACALAVLTYIHRVGFAAAGPDLKHELALDDVQFSRIMTLFMVAYALFEVPGGLLGDKLGVRHLLTILVLGWSIMTASVIAVLYLPAATIWPFLFLAASRFLFGMFQAGAFPSMSRMMTDWMPMRERATAQGWIWMSARAGGALSPFLVAPLVVYFGNWQLPLVLLAGLGLVWCVVFWPWFRDRPEDMWQVNTAELSLITSQRVPAARHGNVPWAAMFKSRSVWALCLMYGFGGTGASFFITLLPTYLKDFRGFDRDEIKWLTGLPLAGGIVACLAGGFLSDFILRRTGSRKWARRLQGAIGLTIAGLAMACTVFVRDIYALGALLCLCFFCNDLSMGPAWAACGDIGEKHAGTLGGAMNMMGNLMAACGAQAAGYFFQNNRPDLVFYLFGILFVLGSASWLLVDVHKPLVPHPAADGPL